MTKPTPSAAVIYELSKHGVNVGALVGNLAAQAAIDAAIERGDVVRVESVSTRNALLHGPGLLPRNRSELARTSQRHSNARGRR